MADKLLSAVAPRGQSTYGRGRLVTNHDQCEGDHDSSQQLVGYGVLLEGVSDGLIVTEETPFERVVLRGKDKEWKSDC